MFYYLDKSPALHQQGILQPVQDEAIDLLLDKHRFLAQFLQDGLHSLGDGWVGIGSRNNLHNWNVVRWIHLRRCVRKIMLMSTTWTASTSKIYATQLSRASISNIGNIFSGDKGILINCICFCSFLWYKPGKMGFCYLPDVLQHIASGEPCPM